MYRCTHCGGVFVEQELECNHVIPLSEGGPDTDENCETLCLTCHDRASGRTRLREVRTSSNADQT